MLVLGFDIFQLSGTSLGLVGLVLGDPFVCETNLAFDLFHGVIVIAEAVLQRIESIEQRLHVAFG